MKNPAQLTNAIRPARNPLMHSPLQGGLLLLALGFGFAFLSTVRAVSPPPDGGYPNGNTAEGENALFSLNTSQATNNTAIGFQALYSNVGSLLFGSGNTAIGSSALFSNTASGGNNTAIGASALFNNTTGSYNAANGFHALYSNINGALNTAIGAQALYTNTSGADNVAIGFNAMSANNTTGAGNTAIGAFALQFNTTGNSNIAIGESAGSNLTTGKNNIDIGNVGVADESAKIRIGNKAHKNTYIAGISGVTIAGGVGVIIDTTGHLGTVSSSARYKEAIQPMNASSEAIFSLQPVKFRYKKELDAQGIPQFGLVAEDVARVDPDLVARDAEGRPYTVRYEAVNAMLLNEFLKEHRKVEEQSGKQQKLEATVAQQQKEIEALTATLKAQAAQIRKVGAQLATVPARRVVANE